MDDEQGKTPDFQRGYALGLERGAVAGYQARCREEVETYLRVIDGGHEIYDRVIKGIVRTSTFADREAERLATLREAHAAELHVGRPVLDLPGRKGCPVCMEAARIANGPEFAWGAAKAHPEIRGGVPAHNGDYGVADRDQERADDRAMEARATRLHAPGCRGAFGVPCIDECTQNPAYGADAYPGGCEFHRERGDGHVPGCGACALEAQRAAGRQA